MRRFYIFFGSIVLCISAVGCSKPSPETARTNTNPNDSTVVNGMQSSNSSTGGQTVIPGIQGAPADANAAQSNGKLGSPQKQGVNPAGPGAAVGEASRPAPDDSTFSSKLTDVAVETRTFRKHPQLLKVEKILEPGKQTIKVYLRNGKIVELPGDRIKNLSSVLAYEILEVAGLNPSATQGSKPEDSVKKQ